LAELARGRPKTREGVDLVGLSRPIRTFVSPARSRLRRFGFVKVSMNGANHAWSSNIVGRTVTM
jgi:hypothetical protein